MNKINNNEYEQADFQGVYKGKSLLTSAEIKSVPWDIGHAQPVVCTILDQAESGKLLDVGCGLGHNAEAAAQRGFQVTAIDSAAVAIMCCKKSMKGDIRFLVRDVCATKLDESFDLILDSALYHAIPFNTRIPYLQEMRRLSHNETRLHIITFAPAKYGMPLPLAIQLSEICYNAEATGWSINSVSRVEYKGNADAITDFCERKNLIILTDNAGFTRLPCWHVVLQVLSQ
ncbi:class I SAM-dependent methyltransferase [Bartonella queenslandensis]|uniref:class I SAM-dependent methyltransferase n=1 Tax=Bartonella queenslandensis TaxID=481138 RepID=UPI001BAA1D3D|nr:class I SAM-dependent methyltransferase [Bartonella queenslandensis]